MRRTKCMRCKSAGAAWRVKGILYCDVCVENVKCKGNEIVNLADEQREQLERSNREFEARRRQDNLWKGRPRTNMETEFKYPMDVLTNR